MSFASKIIPIGNHFDSASERELLAAEVELGMPLPVPFRELQLKYGRCTFDGDAIVPRVSGPPLDIFVLFGCKGEANNCVTDFRAHPEFVAEGLLPIADDIFNNRYVWSATTGQVSFVDYTGGLGMVTVAESLEQFFERIEVLPDE